MLVKDGWISMRCDVSQKFPIHRSVAPTATEWTQAEKLELERRLKDVASFEEEKSVLMSFCERMDDRTKAAEAAHKELQRERDATVAAVEKDARDLRSELASMAHHAADAAAARATEREAELEKRTRVEQILAKQKDAMQRLESKLAGSELDDAAAHSHVVKLEREAHDARMLAVERAEAAETKRQAAALQKENRALKQQLAAQRLS